MCRIFPHLLERFLEKKLRPSFNFNFQGVVLAIIDQFASFEVEESFVQRSNTADNSLSQGQLTMSITFDKPEAVIQTLALCQDVGPFTITDFLEDPEFPSVLKGLFRH